MATDSGFQLGFHSIIAAIHAEISPEFLPEAIGWCDRKLDGVWSKAIDRFDERLSLAWARGDLLLAKVEGEFYKKTILDALSEYKKAHNLAEADAFMRALRGLGP